MLAIIEGLIGKGYAYQVGGDVYFEVAEVPALRPPLRQQGRRARRGHAHRGARGEAPPGRFRALEERPQAPDEVAEPLRARRLPGLAHRVLGDVAQAPRRPARHPHRRRGQHLPAPRVRDRAERGLHRPALRELLDARQVPAGRRRQDVQEPGQRLQPRRRQGQGLRAARAALLPDPRPLPRAAQLHLGDPEGERCGTREPRRPRRAPAQGRARRGSERRARTTAWMRWGRRRANSRPR